MHTCADPSSCAPCLTRRTDDRRYTPAEQRVLARHDIERATRELRTTHPCSRGCGLLPVDERCLRHREIYYRQLVLA